MIWKLTWKHLRSRPFSSFMTLAAVALSLALLGSFWTVIENLERVKVSQTQDPSLKNGDENTGSLTVFVDPKLANNDVELVKDKILQDKRFTNAEIISSEEAIKALEQQFGETLSKAFGGDTLPITMKVSFQKGVLNREDFLASMNSLRSINGVLDVDDGTTLLGSTKTSLSDKVFSMATGLLLLVFAVVALLVSHLIRLAFEGSRQEIETMKVLGATRAWIFMPLLVEGLFFGVAGSIISLVILSIAVRVFLSRYAFLLLPKGFDFVSLSGVSALSLILLSVIASIAGSLLSWPLVKRPPAEL